jgi:hypothetical protein
MMSEVNVLWSSAWLTLQKNLASSFGAAGFVANSPTLNAPVQVRALPASSWLVRARSRKQQGSRIIQ